MANKKQWFERVAERCRKRGQFIIIKDRESKEDYLTRYYLHPRWLTLGLFRVVIHYFNRSDDDSAFHDHPWIFWGSKLLKGKYVEHTPKGSFRRIPGKMRFYTGWALHQIELDKHKNGKEKGVWTLFLMGPKIRDWGFIGESTRGKWIHWETYLKDKLSKRNNLTK